MQVSARYPTASQDAGFAASIHPANAQNSRRKNSDMRKRKIPDVRGRAGRGRAASGRGPPRPGGCCAPYGQGGRCCWMLPPPREPPAPGYAAPNTWIWKESLVPGSPASVTSTRKSAGPRLLLPEPKIVVTHPTLVTFEIDVLSRRKSTA